MPDKLPETPRKVSAIKKYRRLRVLLTRHLPEEHLFEAYPEEEPQQLIRISYGKTDRHDLHENFFRKMTAAWTLPLMACIEDVSVDEAGTYHC